MATVTLNITTTTVSKTTVETGCYVDGHWGQYGPIRQIEITDEMLSTDFMGELPKVPEEFKAENTHSSYPVIDMDRLEEILWVSNRAEEALNAATPDGFSWGWHDGEYFLWSQESWEEI
jgi:hypothetical protein